MTHKEIANKWGISVKTFYRWKKRWDIPDTLLTRNIEDVAVFLRDGGNIKHYNWDKKDTDTQGHIENKEESLEGQGNETQEDSGGQKGIESADFIDFLRSQVETKDKQIETLHERIREQNILLRENNLLLGAGKQREDSEDRSANEEIQPVTRNNRGDLNTMLISFGVIFLVALIIIVLWLATQR